MRSINSIKDAVEQLHFIITKITKNFGQQDHCAIYNALKKRYFLACQKICRTYINTLFTIKFIVLNEECIASILHKSALSKFLSVNRDVNFSTRKSVGRTCLTFGRRYDKFGRKKEINY